MKYKNISNKVKMFKKDGEWVSVSPEEVVELSKEMADVEGNMELVKKEEKIAAKKKVKKEALPKSKEELNSMTKDELNDYAAKNGLEKVSSRMKKGDMVKAILKHLK